MKHPTKTCRRVEGGGARGLHLSDFDAVLLVPHVGGCSVKPWTGFAAILRPVFEVPDTTKWGLNGAICDSQNREVTVFHRLKISQFLVH